MFCIYANDQWIKIDGRNPSPKKFGGVLYFSDFFTDSTYPDKIDRTMLTIRFNNRMKTMEELKNRKITKDGSGLN